VKGTVQLLLRCLALAFCLLPAAAGLGATDLTGTFHKPDGMPVNGKLIFLLSQPARLADGSAQVVPMVKIFEVVDGQLEAGAFIYGNDVLLPGGTHYVVRLVDSGNNLLFEQKWSIAGETLDLGTMTPTTVGVVLADPLVKNSTTEQAVDGPVTFTSPVTAFSLTLNGDLNPGAANLYALGSAATPWREVVTSQLKVRGPSPWFDIAAFGAVCDDVTDDWPALVAAFEAAVAAGGGTVLIPPQPTQGAQCFMSGGTLPPTFSNGAVRPVTIKLQANIRLGAPIEIPLRRVDIDGSLGQATFSQFMYTRTARITGDAGVSPLLYYRASSANQPADPPDTGGQERTANLLRNVALLPAADQDGVWIHGNNTHQAEGLIMEGIFSRVTGSGNNIWIDTALWIWLRDNWTLRSDGPGTGYTIKITDDGNGTGGQGTGLIRVSDGIMVGRGVYFANLESHPQHGNLIFRNITTESTNTPFLTYDSTAGTTLRNLSFENVEMADVGVGSEQPLIKLVDNPGTGVIESVWVVNSSGKKDNARIVETPVGKEISGLFVHGNATASALAGGSAAIGQSTRGTFMVERGGRLHLGGANAGRGFNEIPALLSRNSIGIKVPGTSTDWTTPVTKANLHVGDGADGGAGDLGTLGGNVIAYFESADATNTDLLIASPSTATGNIRFGRVGATSAGRLAYQHASDRWLFQVQGTGDVLRISAGEQFRVNQQIRWLNNTSFEGRLAHANSATRTYTFPDATGSVPVTTSFTASLNFPSIPAHSCSELTISAGGVATGDPVMPAWPASLEAGLTGIMYVSAAGTVAVRLCNVTESEIDPASQTFAGRVVK
jgi:hypothetical protein